ncbi:MAG TPA: HEPN domain-containing protein [Bacteroidetes bacterium]|nr:HEPN domain-containing protein [Bacteroidota bacterium]
MNPNNPSDWLLKADRDFGLASHAHKHALECPDLICYHCQQAAEKCLKALAIHFGLPLRRTHDLENLLDLLAPSEPSIAAPFYDQARILNDYGILIRYPGPSGDPSENDVLEALAAALFFRDFAGKIIGA